MATVQEPHIPDGEPDSRRRRRDDHMETEEQTEEQKRQTLLDEAEFVAVEYPVEGALSLPFQRWRRCVLKAVMISMNVAANLLLDQVTSLRRKPLAEDTACTHPMHARVKGGNRYARYVHCRACKMRLSITRVTNVPSSSGDPFDPPPPPPPPGKKATRAAKKRAETAESSSSVAPPTAQESSQEEEAPAPKRSGKKGTRGETQDTWERLNETLSAMTSVLVQVRDSQARLVRIADRSKRP